MSKDPFLKNWNCGQIVSGLKKKYPGKIWKKSCQWMNCVYCIHSCEGKKQQTQIWGCNYVL